MFPADDIRTSVTEIETPHGVLCLYENEHTDGTRFRNVELIRVENDPIVETQVFFGGQGS